MNNPTKSTSKPDEASAGTKPRRIRVAALLNAAATLGAAVLVAALSGPKLPRYQGD